MASSKRKSWEEKLNVVAEPKVERSDKDFAGIRSGQKMLIPTPRIVDEYIRQIPEGRGSDIAQLRKDLAAQFGAEVTCPLTSGIFLRICAEAAYEQYVNGKALDAITPFWRIMDEKSTTAKKLSFGKEFLTQQRKRGIIRLIKPVPGCRP